MAGPHRVTSAADEVTPLLAAAAAGPTVQPNEEALITPEVRINGTTAIYGATNGHANGHPTANGGDSDGHATSTSPLLKPSTTAADSSSPLSEEAREDEDKELDKTQIFLLCFCRLVEPIAFFCIFPFLPQMIERMGGVEKEDVGFYSGLIESLFSLTQMLLMIPWGRAADRYGRKPVLVVSLAGASSATALFGFSRTIWQMILFRCTAGIFAGTIVTVRAMITENTTKKTQARAFGWFAFAGNLGIFLGPLIGGCLEEPAEQFPRVFKGVWLFEEFPFALPTLVTGSVFIICTITTILFVKETYQGTAKKEHEPGKPKSTWELINYPGVGAVLYLTGHVMVLAMAYTAIAPVFWFTPVELGGFGFSPFMISIFFAIAGLSQSVWLLLVFPSFQHRYNTGGVLRLCAWAWPISFAFNPISNILLRHNLVPAFWILSISGLVAGSGVSMAFTAISLALNDISPSPEMFGTLNALALALTSAVRACMPAMFSSLYAVSVRTQVLGGHLVWVILIFLATTLRLGLRWLPEKAEGRLDKKKRVDEEDST